MLNLLAFPVLINKSGSGLSLVYRFFSKLDSVRGIFFLTVKEEINPVKRKINLFYRIISGFLSGFLSAPMGIGGGIIHTKANEELFELARKFQIPVVTTLMGRGAFPDGNELCFEMPGMHGNYTATTSIQKSDLLIPILSLIHI